jgi:para-nitrobenzyl esterase
MKKIITGLTIFISCGLFAQLKQGDAIHKTVSPIVKTVSGLVQGIIDGDVSIFKGIPYAAPPVGEFRWRPPQTVKPWTEIRDASQYGLNCAQAGWGAAPGTISEGSGFMVAHLYLVAAPNLIFQEYNLLNKE